MSFKLKLFIGIAIVAAIVVITYLGVWPDFMVPSVMQEPNIIK